MKKIILLLIIAITLIIPNNVQATEERNKESTASSINTENIIESQKEMLDINSFIEEADKYTKDVYEDLDMGELFSSAIAGNIDNGGILKSILNLVRRRSN